MDDKNNIQSLLDEAFDTPSGKELQPNFTLTVMQLVEVEELKRLQRLQIQKKGWISVAITCGIAAAITAVVMWNSIVSYLQPVMQPLSEGAHSVKNSFSQSSSLSISELFLAGLAGVLLLLWLNIALEKKLQKKYM